MTSRRLSRRDFARYLPSAGAAALIGPLESYPAQVQAGTGFSTAEIMAPGPLPDIVQGKADAPVTIVEYASMTCPHCARFNVTVLPWLETTYIKPGKVRFILREFPYDPLAAAAFMLARCEGADKRDAVVDLLFAQQQSWAFSDKPLEALRNAMKLTGMSQGQFDTCLNDQTLQEHIYAVADRGSSVFGVSGTPTFFVNGEKVTGEMTRQSLAKMIDPLVAKRS